LRIWRCGNSHSVYRNGKCCYCRGVIEAEVVQRPDELTVDEVAAAAGLPVRTIREYQTMGLLPAPERRGRVGVYRASHVARLELIGRLQARGYSLAGIGDLVTSWRDGADLGEVLGLEPDQLVHLDEPGTPATLDQLAVLLPSLVPDRLEDVIASGLVESCGPDRYCVPSPSLLQLSIDALAAGYDPDRVLGLLATIRSATATIAGAAIDLLADRPKQTGSDQLVALATRGRGLLAHGTGRLTVHAIGRSLGIDHDTDTTDAIRTLLGAST
jgi:DNA-binding transcriptional MerR regulator